VVRLVGSGNHLCELLFREDDLESTFLTPFGETFAKGYLEMLFFYNQRAPYEKKITREQIPFVLKKISPELADKDQALAVDYRACALATCQCLYHCSFHQGLHEVTGAEFISVNQSLKLNGPRSSDRPQFIHEDVENQ